MTGNRRTTLVLQERDLRLETDSSERLRSDLLSSKSEEGILQLLAQRIRQLLAHPMLLEAFSAADLQVAEKIARERAGRDEQVLMGLNCRDLDTLEIDFNRFQQLRSHMPGDWPCVAESGVQTAEDVARVARLGYRLALVGTSLMQSADPAQVSHRARDRGRKQLGTLGSGNHFLEIEYVERIFEPEIAARFGLEAGQAVVLIHCGSRGLGHQVCTDYVGSFQKAVRTYGIRLPDRELVCAPLSSPEGRAYLAAMSAAVRQAASRAIRVTVEIAACSARSGRAIARVRIADRSAGVSRPAIDRIERPATTPREISSRSGSVNARIDRRLGAGLIPPVRARIPCTAEWFRSNSWAIFCSESPFCQRSHISAFWLSV